MKTLAALAFGATILAGISMAQAQFFQPPPNGIVASTAQPNRPGNPSDYMSHGFFSSPRAYYGQPELKSAYYTTEWCRTQGEYNPYSGQVREPNGTVWQCGPPRY